jgi:hypothetical protein
MTRPFLMRQWDRADEPRVGRLMLFCGTANPRQSYPILKQRGGRKILNKPRPGIKFKSPTKRGFQPASCFSVIRNLCI